jgi:uncharacterized damage-inducible protein DinB
MIDWFSRLFAHLQWADERALASLRQGVNHPHRALELYAHILGSEHTWLSRINDTAPTVAVWPSLAIDACESLARENHAAFAALLQGLDEAGLARVVHYRNSTGAEFDSTVSEILTHVALHGAYHRGQVAALVRAAGDAPQATDFIVYARSGGVA